MSKTQLASDRLIEAVRPFTGDSVGIAIKDIARMPLTPDTVADIFECLKSKDVSELKWGLWFAEGVIDSKPPNDLRLFLVQEIPKWNMHENEDVRERALPLMIRLANNFSDYRSMMLRCLNDQDSTIRAEALAAYETFLTKKDIPLLLLFQDDKFMSETSMGSPLIYPIRNQALVIIEKLCGHLFLKHEKIQVLEDGHTVSWWDWKPFLDWWSVYKPMNWRFWRW